MNDTDNEFIYKIPDKGDRFIFADEKTDKEKANEQTRKGNFKRIDFNLTSPHIQKLR